jgi:O-acetyl-ADP-ribose deacetylase (regulator of RNase III)
LGEFTAGKTAIHLTKGDITEQATDAIVNAANSGLMGGGGVDGAIHRAGGPRILEECRKIIARIGRLETGKAVITTGGNLKAKYVVHTVGPIWRGGKAGEQELLASTYTESLKLASAYKLQSIAFPSISTGAYGYPLAEAASVALTAVVKYLRENNSTLDIVNFVLFDSTALDKYADFLKSLED